MFEHVRAGDRVTRILAGIKMNLLVTRVTPELIICGGDETDHEGWWFDPKTGAEIDEELGWGPPPKKTGSYLARE